jgi:TetR/AcrR family transcriptional regulator
MTRSAATLHTQLLEVSLRLFAAHGFRGTSLQDIATEVGCSKASLLYHFGSKETILAELLAPALEAADELNAQLAGIPDDRVAEVAVEGVVDLVLRFQREITLLLGDVPESTMIPALSPTGDRIERLMGALAGRSERPQDRLRAWMVLGAVVLACAGGPKLEPEQMREQLLAGALRLV